MVAQPLNTFLLDSLNLLDLIPLEPTSGKRNGQRRVQHDVGDANRLLELLDVGRVADHARDGRVHHGQPLARRLLIPGTQIVHGTDGDTAGRDAVTHEPDDAVVGGHPSLPIQVPRMARRNQIGNAETQRLDSYIWQHDTYAGQTSARCASDVRDHRAMMTRQMFRNRQTLRITKQSYRDGRE